MTWEKRDRTRDPFMILQNVVWSNKCCRVDTHMLNSSLGQNPRGDVTPSRVACDAPQILYIPFSIILQTRHFTIVLTLLWASRISYSTRVMTLGWEYSNILNVLAAVLAACYPTQLIYKWINYHYWIIGWYLLSQGVTTSVINQPHVWMAQEKNNYSREHLTKFILFPFIITPPFLIAFQMMFSERHLHSCYSY